MFVIVIKRDVQDHAKSPEPHYCFSTLDIQERIQAVRNQKRKKTIYIIQGGLKRSGRYFSPLWLARWETVKQRDWCLLR